MMEPPTPTLPEIRADNHNTRPHSHPVQGDVLTSSPLPIEGNILNVAPRLLGECSQNEE
jgi:hypothetical protein